MKDLAIAMIVKNEVYDIERCFKSFFDNGLFPDFYCIDTGSTDNTVELIKSYGAYVKEGNPVTEFDKSRNEVFDFIFESGNNYKWIMCIDADESLDVNLAFEINKFISDNYLYNLYDAAWVHNTAYIDSCYDSKLMIVKAEKVKSGQVKYKYSIHEELDRDNLLRERIFDIYGNLWHYSNKPQLDTNSIINKNKFYAKIAQEFKDTSYDWYAEYIYAVQYGYYMSLIGYTAQLKENFDIAIDLALNDYNKNKTPEFRFIIQLLCRYYKQYGISEQWNKLLWKSIENNYLAPQLAYIIADMYYKKGGKYNTKKAIHYLESIVVFKIIYQEDLFQMNTYELYEKCLELISLWSWDIGDKDRSISAYKELKARNFKNTYIVNNKEFYENLTINYNTYGYIL